MSTPSDAGDQTGHSGDPSLNGPVTTTPVVPGWLMTAAMIAVAGNLRTAITSVPPLIDEISASLGLSHAAAGALTTLPVLCMGLFAPIASKIAHRIGAVAAVQWAMVAILVGIVCRWFGDHVVLLYLGTFTAGVGIALAGTLLPRLVKTFFPAERAGLYTGLYMFAMMVGAAIASAVSVPLAERFGSWQASLGSWSVIALLGLLAWLPITVRANPHQTRGEEGPGSLPWRHTTAWLLSGYLALQSWAFYSSVTWLPPTYVEHDWTPTAAGLLGAVFSGMQVISGLVGPVLSDRVSDARTLLLPSAVLGGLGCLGIFLAPMAAPWLWAVLLGLGQGSAFSVGLVLLVRYAASPAASGRLTGMAFLVSYCVASIGPLAMGMLRDVAGNLGPVWLVLALLSVVQGAVVMALRPTLPRVD